MLETSRSTVVMDDIFCIFNGYLHNTCDLRRSYGLSRQATEAMVIVAAYTVLRDRAPYPADQVIKELDGKFSFILFDSKASKLFLAQVINQLYTIHKHRYLLISHSLKSYLVTEVLYSTYIFVTEV